MEVSKLMSAWFAPDDYVNEQGVKSPEEDRPIPDNQNDEPAKEAEETAYYIPYIWP